MNHKLINCCTALCLLAAGTVMAGDKAAMIASATSAGPESVTANATVKDSWERPTPRPKGTASNR